VKLVERKALPNGDHADAFVASFGRWEKLPAVFARDVVAEKETFLHVGWSPVVSFDGRYVLVSNLDGDYRRVEVQTGKSAVVSWGGKAWSGAFAYPATDIVLSWSLPTQGAKIKYTENNSPLRGPKQMLTLKL